MEKGIKVFDNTYDEIIKSGFLDVKVSYKFALQYLYPLINKLNFQRNQLSRNFYKRLGEDIVNGCIMPPITIAIRKEYNENVSDWEDYVISSLNDCFVLDGIQRLTTLYDVSKEEAFDFTRPLYVNVLICSSMNKLLYRMITLNNGQKPMSARHQIEILASNIINFDSLSIIPVSEKDKSNKIDEDKNKMNKDNLIKGYLAFMTCSINIDNQKIIEERMDILITDKMMESGLQTRETEFSEVIDYIEECVKAHTELKEWFEVINNFIGFSASAGKNFQEVLSVNANKLLESISIFEDAFNGIDVSKIQLGKARRRMVKFYFDKFAENSKHTSNELLDIISQEL